MPVYFKYAVKLQILLIQDFIGGKGILIILLSEHHSKDYPERQHLLVLCRKDWKATKESCLNLEEEKKNTSHMLKDQNKAKPSLLNTHVLQSKLLLVMPSYMNCLQTALKCAEHLTDH